MTNNIVTMSRGRQLSLMILTLLMLGVGGLAIPQAAEAAFSSCSSSSYTCTSPSGYSGQRYWGLTTNNGHNCATFVAYVMAKSGATSTSNPGWAVGGLTSWPSNAKRAGLTVNSTPNKGSIFFDIRSGQHVAIVVAVTDSYVYLREDNWSGTTKWRRIPKSGFNSTSYGFIHVNDSRVRNKLEAWGWDNVYGG